MIPIASQAPRGGAPVASISSVTSLYQQDAPPCPDCGAIMIRSGACYKCMELRRGERVLVRLPPLDYFFSKWSTPFWVSMSMRKLLRKLRPSKPAIRASETASWTAAVRLRISMPPTVIDSRLTRGLDYSVGRLKGCGPAVLFGVDVEFFGYGARDHCVARAGINDKLRCGFLIKRGLDSDDRPCFSKGIEALLGGIGTGGGGTRGGSMDCSRPALPRCVSGMLCKLSVKWITPF